jgi:SNF2 family DNA or RNA helicase
MTQVVSEFVSSVVFDGHNYAVQFNYFKGVSDAVKSICKDPGKRWHVHYFSHAEKPYFRNWQINKGVIAERSQELYDALKQASAWSRPEDFNAFITRFELAQANIRPGAFIDDLQFSIYPLQQGLVLKGSYHPGAVALLKNMQGRYLMLMKAWRLEATPMALKYNLMTELGLNDEQIEVMDFEYELANDALSPVGHDHDGIRTSNNMVPEAAPAGDDEENHREIYLAVTSPIKSLQLSDAQIEQGLSNYQLYDYQQVGFKHLIQNTSALLADDMGLGKSRQAIAAAHFMAKGRKILIACPASLIINWTREIQMVVPDASIGQQRYSPDVQWVVINYERLTQILPVANQFEVMVIDEAHSLKEASSQRTRLAFDIASKVPLRYILTGTPILNSESEIHTLLRLSGHPVGDIPMADFVKEFAGSSEFRKSLNGRIKEWMLRRIKEVVLKTLKGKQHQLLYVNPSENHALAYSDIAKDSSLTAFVKIIRLRIQLEASKLDAVMNLVSEMGAEDKVLIFCEFKESVRTLYQRLSERNIQTVTLTGEDTSKKRQQSVDQFQQNTEVRVFIGTTMAAGVGINLTAANYVIFASLPWTPALQEQAEDRAYRIGQQRTVIVKIPLIDNTIDNDLWQMLKVKKNIATETLNPEEAEKAVQAELARILEQKQHQQEECV